MKSDKDYSECQTSFEDDLDQIQHEYDLLLLKELSVEHAKNRQTPFPNGPKRKNKFRTTIFLLWTCSFPLCCKSKKSSKTAFTLRAG